MTKYCPSCGEELVDNANFCKSCGYKIDEASGQTTGNPAPEYRPQVVENDHKAAVIIGYILAVLIPLFGLIAGVYLYTRKDSESAKNHGKYVIIVALIVWFISFLLIR